MTRSLQKIKLLDSRRLTGPNLLWNKCGAVIDVQFSHHESRIVESWTKNARKMMYLLGWSEEQTCVRLYPQGASLAISAPLDALYVATEINEWCWNAAVKSLQKAFFPDYKEMLETFQKQIKEESNPPMLEIAQIAEQHDLPFLRDDDEVSLGYGRFSQTWPADDLPDVSTLDISGFESVPLGLVTGTNGKTTSVRLAAHIACCAGLNAGISSTDAIAVNDQIIDLGDYSGPGGARCVLRDKRVDIAILETARGGLLRRGLGVDRAKAALITNVAQDHMGEFGVQTLEELADVKWIVSSVINASSVLVLNADDPLLVSRGKKSSLSIAWFSINPDNPLIRKNILTSRCACTVEQGKIVFYKDGDRHEVLEITQIPITLQGAAVHNVQNVLGVVVLVYAMGITLESIKYGLKTFSDRENPGRCNQFMINGARVIVDFAHNPHGMKALTSLAENLPAKRKLLITGQAGDRSNEDIRQLARESIRKINFDKIIVKLMKAYDRGRKEGEVAQIIKDEYIHCGVEENKISLREKEMDAVNEALDWAQPQDLLILLIHEDRAGVLKRLNEMQV